MLSPVSSVTLGGHEALHCSVPRFPYLNGAFGATPPEGPFELFLGFPPPRSSALPFLMHRRYRLDLVVRLLGALSSPRAMAPGGEHGDTRGPRGQNMCLSLQKSFRALHTPSTSQRGCSTPIGCALVIIRRNQKVLSLACPFVQLPSPGWPAEGTSWPRPLRRPLTQPLARSPLPLGLGLACCPPPPPAPH